MNSLKSDTSFKLILIILETEECIRTVRQTSVCILQGKLIHLKKLVPQIFVYKFIDRVYFPKDTLNHGEMQHVNDRNTKLYKNQ